MLSRSSGCTRRSFLAGTVAASGLLADNGTAVAKTNCGQVRGVKNDAVYLFKGIPYAGSPEGSGRFKPAPKLKPWTGVRDALVYGPQSIQAADPMWPKDWKPAVSAEDCLYLNIWTQGIADGKKRPVMFYSHGGGFATGNGGAEVVPQNQFHDGGALARDYDVVVVTHNHRLNIMGYLYLGDLLGEEYADSGMAGMLDIAAALRWVHDNIASFGGDPGKVMIWGESGGGYKTSVLTAMPAAKGTFQRASVESGSGLRMRTRESAAETARAVLDALGLTEKQARQLLTIPSKKLIDAMQALPSNRGLGFSPMVDGHNLPAHPYDPVAPAVSADVPLITGINKDETLFFYRSTDAMSMEEDGLKKRLGEMLKDNAGRVLEVYRRSRPDATPAELFIAITTAQWMGNNAIRMAERKAALHAAPVYMYIFAYDSPSPGPTPYHSGSGHAAEMPFKFNHVPGDPATDKKARAARNMSKAWATFARTGNPSWDGIPNWPAYTLDRRSTMILDAECKVIGDPYREERILWENL